EVEPARHPGEGFQGGGQVDGPQVVAGALEARQPVGRPTRSVPVEDDSGAPEPTMDHEAGKGGPAGGEQFGHPDVLAPQVRSGTPETSAPVGVEVPTGEACERLEGGGPVLRQGEQRWSAVNPEPGRERADGG